MKKKKKKKLNEIYTHNITIIRTGNDSKRSNFLFVFQ